MESDENVREVGQAVLRLGLRDGLRGWRRLDRGFRRGSRYMHQGRCREQKSYGPCACLDPPLLVRLLHCSIVPRPQLGGGSMRDRSRVILSVTTVHSCAYKWPAIKSSFTSLHYTPKPSIPHTHLFV